MHVKSLRIAGFKSFADPTILEFDAGVNVIVGPNGSGKSNIADALSWVLGSQAPSTLRGASMEDVIFAGSETRPRLGMAEVEITLDNSRRVLPLDLEEVTISRSTDRSGASEYRINGGPCRLLDVTELLSDTGIGRSIHTIVGQGQLDQVLQARPEERRGFIEEAAQIGKYRRRKDRALRKIERVEENLTRLDDVLNELRRSLRPLKRQATAATVYSELLTEHTELKQRLAATEVQRLAAERARVDPRVEAHRAELLAEELAAIRARLEGAVARRHQLAGAADAARQVGFRLARVTDGLASLARIAHGRTETLAAQLAAETEEGYRERIRLVDAERVRWEERSALLEPEARTRHDAARSVQDRAAAASTERAVVEERLAAARVAATAAQQDLVRAEGTEAAGRAALASAEARVHAAQERRDVAQRQLESLVQEIRDAEAEVAALATELDQAVEEAAAAEAKLEEARERTESLRASAALSYADRAAATARVDALHDVTRLLHDRHDVLELIRPLLDEAQARAEVAGSHDGRAQGLVVAAEQEVERLWQVVAGHDEEVRRLDALTSGATDRVGGRRRQYETREVELATLDDEVARSQDAVASAQRSVTEARAGVPARRAAVEEAERAVARTEAELVEARARERDAADEAGRLLLEARTAQERAAAARLRHEEAEAGIRDAEAALAGLEERRAELGALRQVAQTAARAAAAAAERGAEWSRAAEARAQSIRAEAEAVEHSVDDLRARERQLGSALEELSRRRSEAEVRDAEIRTRTQALAERTMDEWGLSFEDLLAIETLEQEAEALAVERAAALEREMKRLGTVNPRAAEEYTELAERETFLVSQMDDLRASRRDLMKVIRDVDDTIIEVFREAFTDVAREFEGVFDRLFPGGRGRITLLDPDDLLGSGVEIEARPPGKNVKKLSLLSGGERALTALAFLFAIFRSRPSPFYLLDEVEAALDDINLQRFLGLIRELQEHAQVLIVTHQKRTMEAADVLYGVSMSKEGVTRVVAKRLEEMADA